MNNLELAKTLIWLKRGLERRAENGMVTISTLDEYLTSENFIKQESEYIEGYGELSPNTYRSLDDDRLIIHFGKANENPDDRTEYIDMSTIRDILSKQSDELILRIAVKEVAL